MIINHLKKSLACLAALTAASSAWAFSPSFYHTESMLNQGHWVKVKVKENGIHQLTYDQLRAMGFDNPENVTVWGYGGASLSHNAFKSTDPDDLPQQYVLHTPDGRVLFYGECGTVAGISNSSSYLYNLNVNYYSNDGYYFLTDCATPKAVEPVARNASNTTAVSSHTAVDFRNLDVENPGQGGAHFFGPSFSAQSDQSMDFTVVDPIDGGNAYVAYVGVCKHSYSNNPQFFITLDSDLSLNNGYNVAGSKLASSIALFGKVNGYQFFNLRTNEGSPIYRVNVQPLAQSGSYDYAALDWVFFSYPRLNTLGELSQRRMIFPKIASYNVVNIADSRADLEVWDVTEPYRIRRFVTHLKDGSTVQFTPDRNYNTSDNPALNVVAFHPSGDFPTPEVVGVVDNQNVHGLSTPHMLIITNDECEAEANRLAQAHRQYQGIDVQVVNQQKLFNEFSSGTPDVMAYRRAAKMFYDRDSSKFRSLLLFGRGCYDNRQIQIHAPGSLLTYQVEDYTQMGNNATNYTSDDYFGMLDDYFNINNIIAAPTQISVGRIPATKADIKHAVDKIVNYLSQPIDRPYRNRALLIADDNDANKHEKQSDSVVDTILESSPQITCTKVYNNMYPWTPQNDALTARTAIIQGLTQGQDYVCYTGHASAMGFTSEMMWHKSYVESTQYSHYPLWMLATCDTYGFDRLDDGIAERMVFAPNGGAIGVIGACRTVYADSNFILSMEVANAFSRARGRSTLGAIYNDARNATIARTEANLRVNTMCYNYCGDPEIPYYSPDFVVTATKINDTGLTGDPVKLYPLYNNVIEGKVTDADGKIEANFNGEVTISIYDGPQTVMTNPKDGRSDPREVTLDETLLAEVKAEVVNGQFTADLTFPVPLRPDVSNRITFYAVSRDMSMAAVGLCSNGLVTDYDESKAMADTSEPEIVYCYLDTPSFNDGDEVGSTTTFCAKVKDLGTGVNMLSSSLTSGASLTLDDTKSIPAVRTSMSVQLDGSIEIEVPVTDLQDGRHKLDFIIADNSGNSVARTINFVAVNRAAGAQLLVDNKTARTDVTFDIQHSFTLQPEGRLVVEDAAGNVVFTRNNCTFPYTWNLRDGQSQTVADGQYRCYAILKAGHQYGHTEPVPFVVIK